MRIEQLVQFCEYIQCRSLTVAAQKLFMTPQALHVSIKRLEEEIRAKLTVKVSGELELTDAGRLFMDFAEKVLAEHKKFSIALEDLQKVSHRLSGKLYVYSNMLFQRKVLPAVIRKFSTDHPEVRLHLFESDTRKIYEDFSETPPEKGTGRVGFLQVPQPKKTLNADWFNTDNYVFQELHKGFFYACCDPKLSLDSQESIRKLLKYPLTLYLTATSSLDYGKEGWKNPALILLSEFGKLNIAYSVNTMELWRATLLSKPCVGVIHSSLVEQNDPIIEGLQLITVKEKLRSNLGCLHSRNKNELEEEFIRYVERYLAQPDS